MQPEGSSPNPPNNTNVVLDARCTDEARTRFVLTGAGSLKHSSGKCLHPFGGLANPANNTPLVLEDGCDESRLQFEFTPEGSLRHVSGKCIRPLVADTFRVLLVLGEGCTDRQNRFRFLD